jgi:hypothetical protein
MDVTSGLRLGTISKFVTARSGFRACRAAVKASPPRYRAPISGERSSTALPSAGPLFPERQREPVLGLVAQGVGRRRECRRRPNQGGYDGCGSECCEETSDAIHG